MEEKEPVFAPEVETIESRSKFGDKEKILEALLTGEVVEVGPIEEVCRDIPPHQNEVRIVDLPQQNANEILAVKIQKGGQELRCVFKPADGENKQSKESVGIEAFYPRECAAYLISEHFKLDIVPPTVIREINGRVGALQLFLDHDYFGMVGELGPAELEQMQEGMDFKKMAILDWILANCERHQDNWLVRRENPQELVAIDHGIILSLGSYWEHALRGPGLALTLQSKEGQRRPRQVPIPQELLTLLEEGFSRQEELNLKLEKLPGISPEAIQSMWKRVAALLHYQVFLSKENYHAVTGQSYLSLQFSPQSAESSSK